MALRRSICTGLLVITTWLVAGGCAPIRTYVANGFKVGPNYATPATEVAEDWIDAGDSGVNNRTDELAQWWTTLGDPTLNCLIEAAADQNLTLREAGCRVLQARAARAIAVGGLFPQQQDLSGQFSRNAMSIAAANTRLVENRFFDQWETGFNLAWELDFWGRFRRAIEAADADLNASIEAYDQVLVTLLADVASTYTEIRTLQRRIDLARQNADLQHEMWIIADARFRGEQVSELDVDQAASTLAQTEALIPDLEYQLRQATNRLCILLGTPPADLAPCLGKGPIPTTPEQVAVGIPVNLVRRRPDVRQAEREVAAQSARVGIAVSDLYPHVAITGTIGGSSELWGDLFGSHAFQGNVGPSFQWNVLNYGRLLNEIRRQDARLAEQIVAYQNRVLQANAEAENGVARFLLAKKRTDWLAQSVAAAKKGMRVATAEYRGGQIDFNRVALVEQNLVDQQDLLTQAQGEIVLGLIETYRALGGGWQIRCAPPSLPLPTEPPVPAEPVPLPPGLSEPPGVTGSVSVR
ncbi:MAG: efflux transporter outer membrane subunit [Pirellulales bacterium]|nr:efflux transporter outer membrane subunit [Pirellulales bacterium]